MEVKAKTNFDFETIHIYLPYEKKYTRVNNIDIQWSKISIPACKYHVALYSIYFTHINIDKYTHKHLVRNVVSAYLYTYYFTVE